MPVHGPHGPAESRADMLIIGARRLLAAGDAAAAEARCREALALHPDHAGALEVLAASLSLQGRCAEAADLCQALVRLQPHEPRHWVNLGTTRRAAGQLEAALGAYMEAARLGEGSADFYLNVGLAQLERRDYEAARAVLARAHALAPEDAEIRYHLANLAQLLTNLGEPRQAQAALERALQDTARDPDVTLTVVQVLERTNRVTEAAALLHTLD